MKCMPLLAASEEGAHGSADFSIPTEIYPVGNEQPPNFTAKDKEYCIWKVDFNWV